MATPRRLLGAAIIGIFGGGCFVGDAANGLPCDRDADCGVGISCVEDPALTVKCCGGSCSLGSSSGSTATTTTTTTSSSTTGPTSLSATEPSSGPAVCGDGVVDAGEACDPQDPRSLPCTDDC
ncbi:MAG: hypothetical protein KUG77_02710, partial [Nannocystaceae bacterium]|nr:hypothetical protein [Nannocystaceae bacterium]